MELKPTRFARSSKKREKKSFFVPRALQLFTLLISVTAFSQSAEIRISLSVTNASLETAFKEIKKQSGYEFVYTREQVEKAAPVTVHLQSAQLEKVLEACFNNQPFSYVLEGMHIILRDRTEMQVQAADAKEISGMVTDEKGMALGSVSVTVSSSGIVTLTNSNGYFSIKNIRESDVLLVSAVGFQTRQVAVRERNYFDIRLSISITPMDETLVMAYGTTTRRLTTGNISKLSSKDIETQPVTNVLAAMEGRMPGVLITQTSGVAGSGFTIEIRGRGSLDLSLSRNDPLFIIDGVPFEQGNVRTNQTSSSANTPSSSSKGGLSPLNTLNPWDIESIEVLKDADATAIYGSRGANGVVLITTKKGKPGKTSVSFNINSGRSRVTRTMDMLTTQEYIDMRREAFANDGLTPNSNPTSAGYAPDITIWDATRYTDFKKMLNGGTAHSVESQLSLSGGSAQSQFLINGGFHRETNIYSNALTDTRGSLHANFNHTSESKRFQMNFSAYYAADKNELLRQDLTQYINLPPNFLLYDSLGRPNWSEKGVALNSFSYGFSSTPAAELLKKYNSTNENLNGNFYVRFKLTNELSFYTNLGYNRFYTDEVSINPKTSVDPNSTTMASSVFGRRDSKSWIVEPQLDYAKLISKGTLAILLGSTLQENVTKSEFITATNYTSDLLLNSMAAAGSLKANNTYAQYRYNAVFGRINYNWNNTYIANLTMRRDGSSRFGPGKQFASFGAAGLAWIFSSEKLKKKISFLSFGKIRGSYGNSGNDQIGDYHYLDLWSNSGTPYQGIATLQPNSLYNPNYEWEINKKFEAAIELGFLKDRIFVSGSYYQNRCSNQLINYLLPVQTGFTSVTKNFPALVENSGVELLMNTKNISSRNWKWNSSFNITIPRNQLISFPGLESSVYALQFEEGKPLNIFRGYQYLGVDSKTGYYSVLDVNGDGKYNTADYVTSEKLDPRFYGGFQNAVQYKNVELNFFLHFTRQSGQNYLSRIVNSHPGLPVNQPVIIDDHWRKTGDATSLQALTSSYGNVAATAAYYFSNSDGIYSDASYLRLKNISLSYNLGAHALKKLRLTSCRLYINAQNIFVLTNYMGSDPETQDIYVLPPLKTVVTGIQFQF